MVRYYLGMDTEHTTRQAGKGREMERKYAVEINGAECDFFKTGMTREEAKELAQRAKDSGDVFSILVKNEFGGYDDAGMVLGTTIL